MILVLEYQFRVLDYENNGILLPKLSWPRRNSSSDGEKCLKFEAEVREFAKFLRSLEQFIQPVKDQNHGLRTPREELAFTARPKIQSQSKVIYTKYSKH